MGLRTRVGSGKTNLQLVTARLLNPKTGKELIINVAIDSCSTGCLMTDYATDHLALKGKIERFMLKGITDAECVIMSCKITAKVSSRDSKFSHILKRVRVLPTITEDAKTFDWRPLLSNFDIGSTSPTSGTTQGASTSLRSRPTYTARKTPPTQTSTNFGELERDAIGKFRMDARFPIPRNSCVHLSCLFKTCSTRT